MINQHRDEARLRAGVLRQVRGAYWAAIGLTAILATASYLLLGGIIEANRTDSRLIDLAGRQQMLSQRIAMLADTAYDAGSQARRDSAVKRLHTALTEFSDNYVAITGVEPDAGRAAAIDTGNRLSQGARAIIADPPYDVGSHTQELITVTNRLLALLPAVVGQAGGTRQPEAVADVQSLTGAIAEKTLSGYSALSQRFTRDATDHIAYTARMHGVVFCLMILLLLLEAFFIFRPMTILIERKTRALIAAHDDMARAAAHDALTDLNNRTFLTQRFEPMIEQAKSEGGRLAVVQIDLDEFKQINDTLGHAAGDVVLKTTAQRIKSCSRSSDICARLGGDEFVVVMPSVGEHDDVGLIASRILAAVNQPIEIDGRPVHVGASAGIAVYPDDAETTDDLMVHSDLALYCAKRDGRGTFRYFSDNMRARLDERRRLEGDIRDAIAGDLFDVHFQPQISLETGAVTGIEALVRWNHPQHGNIPPATFLPVAEKSGLMCEVGRIAIRKAIMQAARWQTAGYVFGRIAVNVSGSEIADPGFVDFVFATLRAAKLPPDRLSIEVLESVVMDDRESGLLSKLAILRKSGIHIELDDFGTGYATLSHINSNAVDRLKIDRQFVGGLDADAKNARIVQAIAELARSMGLAIIAEGAETQEELDSLAALGCYDVQGYSIAFPMPATEASDWLEAHASRRLVSVSKAKKTA